MAIGIRTVTSTITTSNPITVTTPSGGTAAQVGDFLLIIHGNDFYTLANMPTPVVSTGSPTVNPITNATVDAGTNQAHIKCWWAVVNSAGAQTVTVTETGAADEDKGLTVFVLTGVRNSSPIIDSNNNFGTAATSQVCASANASNADDYLVAGVGSGTGSSSASYTPPGGMNEQYDSQVGGYSMAGATQQLVASGATGTKTFVAFNACPWGAYTIILATESGQTITPDSITAPITFGNPTLSQSFTITPDSLDLAITLGNPTLSQASPLGFDPVEGLALQLLECLQAQATRLGLDSPGEFCLRVGNEIAHSAGLIEDLCCTGLGYVSVGDIYPSVESFPEQDIIRQIQGSCPPPAWSVQLQVGIVRCIPTGDADSGPSCQEWNEAAVLNMRDAQVLRLVACCFRELVVNEVNDNVGIGMSVVIGRQIQSNPLGGCVERYVTLQVQFPNFDCGC